MLLDDDGPDETRPRSVHVVVPEGFDDPRRPSGGNHYDRKVCRALEAAGWRVTVHAVPGSWPDASATGSDALAGVLAGVPDGGVVLADGLVASPSAEVLVAESVRLRTVVLVHMPLGGAGAPDAVRGREAAGLRAARAVVTTSCWAARLLREEYDLPAEEVHVAWPGVDRAEPARVDPAGSRLLCVAAVTPGKGQDVLVRALATLADLPWRCTFVGSREVDPEFADGVRLLAERSGVASRLEWTGALSATDVGGRYAASDLLVHPTLRETYGMVVAEALAHGLPVLATDVGGVEEALGRSLEGLPGVLLPAGDVGALAHALRGWFSDPHLRHRLRRAARSRSATLARWPTTADRVARALVAAAR